MSGAQIINSPNSGKTVGSGFRNDPSVNERILSRREEIKLNEEKRRISRRTRRKRVGRRNQGED